LGLEGGGLGFGGLQNPYLITADVFGRKFTASRLYSLGEGLEALFHKAVRASDFGFRFSFFDPHERCRAWTRAEGEE
jgi:hypothetical protein